MPTRTVTLETHKWLFVRQALLTEQAKWEKLTQNPAQDYAIRVYKELREEIERQVIAARLAN